jgi:hypothetical protein
MAEAKEKKWVLAKGQGLKIDGMGKVMVTNANVNDPTIITIVTNIEKRTGRKYFGTQIIQK